jgi:hypothetical protein
MIETAGQIGGEIRLEHATLRGQDEGSQTRYTVSLSRPADARFIEALRQVHAENPQLRRLQLEPGGAAFAFSCRSVEGPSGVFEMLQRAESLLELLGRRLEEATPRDVVPAAPRLRRLA